MGTEVRPRQTPSPWSKWRLPGFGVTLRHRAGETGPPWTLKLPGGQEASAFVRRELVFEGPAATVPAQARDLLTCLRGYLRSQPLQQVARLCTNRTAVKLCDQAATPVAEVVDDVVTVYQDIGAPASSARSR